MAIESTIIIDKLKEEGINEALGTGLSFESEDQLTGWIETYKTNLPQIKKGLEDYTKDELEELAKDPQFKGFKNLQSFVDSKIAKSKPAPANPPAQNPDNEILNEIRKELAELKATKVAETFEQTLAKIGKEEGLDDRHIARVKRGLSTAATEAQIKSEIADYKKELAELGIKEFGKPGSGQTGSFKPENSLSRKYAEKHKKK